MRIKAKTKQKIKLVDLHIYEICLHIIIDSKIL